MSSAKLAAASGNYDLGNAGSSQASLKVIQITVGALVGSFVVQARLIGSSLAYKAIDYRRRHLNGAVGDSASVSTAITGDSIIEVNAAGLEIRIAYTHTSGTLAGADLSWSDCQG